MKLKNKILPFLFLATATASCIDDFEEINSDPNKMYEVNLQSLFPGTVYRTMNTISELNLNRMMSYSRYVTIGYAQKVWDEKGDSYYRQFYVDILRDLNDLERRYENDANAKNYKGIIKTWKAFVYYQMLSLWGPVGLSDTGLDTADKRTFKYDSEESGYMQIFGLLDVAVDSFDPYAADKLVKDPVYDNGDILKWRKFANTLRLEIAMNIQNISEEKAREYAAKSMEHEDWLFSSLDDALNLRYGSVDGSDGSFYYTRLYKDGILKDNWGNVPSLNEYFAVYLFSYQDPRMEVFFHETNHIEPDATPYRMPDYLTRPHDCTESKCGGTLLEEHLQAVIDGKELRDSLWVEYSIDYVPTPDGPGSRKAFGWEAPYDETDPNHNRRIPDPLSMPNSRSNSCYIKENFYAINTNLPLLRWAEACFLCAEAKIKFGLGSKSAQDYYEAGILASFEEYGIKDKATAYMAQNGVKWNTDGAGFNDTRKLFKANINGQGGDENHLEQIYKQRYFAGFLNGLSAWRMERRTRALDFPPFFYNGSEAFEEGGNKDFAYPERMYFPDAERQTNADAYYEAISILQKNSPSPNTGRWGDNVFTALQMTKPVAGMDEKVAEWKSIQYVPFNMEMQEKKYGKNYEEFAETARKMTGITEDDERALDKAFHFKISGVIKTYIVESPNK